MKTSTGSPSGCTVDITMVEIGLVLSLEEDLQLWSWEIKIFSFAKNSFISVENIPRLCL